MNKHQSSWLPGPGYWELDLSQADFLSIPEGDPLGFSSRSPGRTRHTPFSPLKAHTNTAALRWVARHHCRTSKPWHCYYANVSPLSLLSRQTGKEEVEKRTHTHTLTQALTQTGTAWQSLFDADAKRLVHWKPPILLFTMALWSPVWCEGRQHAPRPLGHMMPSTSKQPEQTHCILVSDLFIIGYQLFSSS